MNRKDWFRPKRYPHIGLPLSYSDRNWVAAYVKDKGKIAQHAFLPFIYRCVKKRRFRKQINEDGSRTQKRVKSTKKRHIYYASHLDSQIYSYYAKILREKYDAKLKRLGINDCVTAYRRLPVNPKKENGRNKCNIDFAKEVFDFISNSNEDELIAITLDISSFFDSLNHKYLKKKWYSLLKSNSLPKDHYNIYKSLIWFSYVNENQLFNEFKDEIIVETKGGKQTKKEIKRRKHLISSRAIAFCRKKQFPTHVRGNGLVKESKYINYQSDNTKSELREKGIPQGTPLSAVLANLYMLDFDKKIYDTVKKAGGLYRRYSDDMVIICKNKDANKLKKLVLNEVKKVSLEIKEEKTKTFRLIRKDDHYSCQEWMPKTETWYPHTNFKYLGFEFDGRRVLLKSSSIAKYYRKMKHSVRRGAFFAKHGSNDDTHIYRKKLYKQFTHIGAERRCIYKRDPDQSDKWIKTYKYNWGNFITYVELASKIMDEPAISRQLKNHWEILNEEIRVQEPKST